ncbi:MAG: tandem-95 repeat protein [Chitinophagaceae bacterium]|nr:tandem-95 repeat protein [Chitinophagaceae bacterium]
MLLQAQNYNPFVAQGIVSPAPLADMVSQGIGMVSFNVGNTGSDPINLVPGQEMILVITLSRGIPNNPNPISAIGGTFAGYFNWLYDAGTKSYQGTQNQTIPDALNGGVGNITIQYRVLTNSINSNPQNGFNVNLTPPAFTNGINALNDDQVSSYTWTEPYIVAIPDINQTIVNTPVSGSVATNDDVIPNSTFTAIGSMSNGVLVLNTDGSYTYTPNLGFIGQDSISYSVCSPAPTNLCDTTTLTIFVTPGLDTNSVVAQDDYGITAYETPLTLCVLCNDNDPQGNTISNPTIIDNPINGTVTVNGNGTVVYTPNTGYSGGDVFSYQICDNGIPSVCDTAYVFVQVSPLPGAVNQTYSSDDSYVTDVNQAFNGNVSLNDTDPQGDVVNFNQITNPSNGTVVFNSDGTFTYTPSNGYVGPDQFIYRKCDDGSPSVCDTATVYITMLNPPTILPVELNSFNLYGEICATQLEWTTSQESNVSHFEILRKTTNTPFEKIGQVAAAGNSQILKSYAYRDATSGKGYFEYRLKIVDIDGYYEYSPVRSVNLLCNTETEIRLYPNPSESNTSLLISTPEASTYEVKMMDAVGQVVFYTNLDLQNETRIINIPIKHLASGLYSVLVSDGIDVKVIRFQKLIK